MPSTLGYVLTDQTGAYLWHGPGFKPLAKGLPKRLPLWGSYREALEAARGLREGIGVTAKVVKIRTVA